MSTGKKEKNEREVIAAELKQVARRRHSQGLGGPPTAAPPADEKLYEEAGKQALVGLAFSGGGIRSATFNLGVLQGLAGLTKFGLVRYVDYLSTVSGGGYIGSWFVAWIKRAGGREQEVAQKLKPQRIEQAAPSAAAPPRGEPKEPGPLFHLRRYSNYLSPRLGLLSVDVWVLWAGYLRNFLVCQLVLLPAVVAVLLLSRLFLVLYHSRTPEFVARWAGGESAVTGNLDAGEYPLGGFIVLLWLLTAFVIFWGAGRVRPDEAGSDPPANPKRLSSRCLFWLVVVPLLVTAILFCWVPAIELYKLDNAPLKDEFGPPHAMPPHMIAQTFAAQTLAPLGGPLAPVAQTATAVQVGALGLQVEDPELVLGVFTPRTNADLPEIRFIDWEMLQRYLYVRTSVRNYFAAFALIPAVVVSIAYLLALSFRRKWGDFVVNLWWTFVACVAGGILLFYLCAFLIWLCRPGPTELSEYVYARAAARVTTFGPPLVLGGIVLTMYIRIALLRNRLDEGLREWWSSLCARLMIFAIVWMSVNLVAIYGTAALLWAGPWAQAAIASGWFLTVIGGVLAGGTSRTDALKPRRGPLDWLALFAPHLFLAGLLVGVSLLLHVLLDTPPNWKHGLEKAEWARATEPPYPPMQLRETTVRLGGVPLTAQTEVVEKAKVFDEATATSRIYWLGMFNTNPNRVPGPRFRLTAADIEYLKTKRGLKEDVARRLAVKSRELHAEEHAVKTPAAFRRAYHDALALLPPAEKALPGVVTQEEVLEAATDVRLIDFNPGLLLAKIGLALLVCLLLIGLAAWRVDVNVFSLHGLYRNRLTRCYLGASRKPEERKPDPITDFDPADELKLTELKIPAGARTSRYNGPYLLVNAALNLVGGKELAWQERKAESFLFSPLYCGCRNTGYCPTSEYAGGLQLSEAMTISGAAASPNAGYHSSPAVTALLTAFNARLGAWLGNPQRKAKRGDRGPRTGFFYLFKELFGQTTDSDSYVYLSDGGHFENLGAYELVRRRCRYIVVSDAGCDPEHLFEDLGNLIRKCRIDFGIPIEIDLDALRKSAEGGRARWHCAVGKVRYDAVDFGAVPGTLVYLKPSLTGDEPADVLHYAARHPAFPHETTANQFFTESQFESYRALGQHVVEMVFAEALDDVEREQSHRVGMEADEWRGSVCQSLFAAVARRWFALPPEYESSFLDSTHGYIDLHKSMADDPLLRPLTLSMYPELAAALPAGAGHAVPAGGVPPAPHPLQQALDVANALLSLLRPQQRAAPLLPGARLHPGAAATAAGQACAEVHALLQMLQIMENAWLSLNLDVNYAHPLNRGWMDIFYRWTNTPLFRRHWPVLRSELARGFVAFCERQMRMARLDVQRRLLSGGEALPAVLTREFGAEWPEKAAWLAQYKAKAGTWCWEIYTQLDGPDSHRLPADTPAGFILVRPDANPPPAPAPAPAACEFLIWVRGAYRNSGIGRPAALKTLADLTAGKVGPAQPFRLIVRLPHDQGSGPGGALLLAMWLTFFHNLGFTRAYQPSPAVAPGSEPIRDKEVILERRFPPA